MAHNDRLRRAADPRRLVNDHHRSAGAATLLTRTLTSLLDDADRGQATLTG